MLSAVLAAPLAAQDSAFRALQDRGKTAMGVDQYTSLHRFDPLPDGGRIALVRDSTDAAGVATIRAHLWDISRAFAAGEFAVPGFVHGREVPGTRVMAPGGNAMTLVIGVPGGKPFRLRACSSIESSFARRTRTA